MNNFYFGSPTVSKHFGILRVTLQEWIMRKYIFPDIKAKGQGSLHLFSAVGIMKLLIFKRLISIGIKREIGADIVNKIPKNEKILFGEMCYLVVEFSSYGNRMSVLNVDLLDSLKIPTCERSTLILDIFDISFQCRKKIKEMEKILK